MTIVTDYGYKTNWVFLTGLGFVGFLLAYRLVFIVTKESETIKKKIVNSIFTTTAK
jgi:hypothetical protein